MIRIYKKGDATKIAANFRAREFDCPGRGCCDETPVDEKLVAFLQKIRAHFGKPISVLGYRCPAYNAKTPNAAPKSKHTLGMAADFHIDGVACAEVAKYAESIGVKGIGLYDDDKNGHFIHIDTRDTKSFWYGHQQEYRSTFGGMTEQEKFVRAVQEAIGAKIDGIAGPETLSKTPTVSARKNSRHGVVAALQKRLYDLGYKVVGKADGIAGPKFEAAVVAFQKDNKCWQDGELTAGKTTWQRILKM